MVMAGGETQDCQKIPGWPGCSLLYQASQSPGSGGRGLRRHPHPHPTQPNSRNSLPESRPLPAWPCGPHRQGFLLAGLVWITQVRLHHSIFPEKGHSGSDGHSTQGQGRGSGVKC